MNNLFVNVLLPLPFDNPFTYKNPHFELSVGHIVQVSFGNRHVWGMVAQVGVKKPDIAEAKIKEILQVNQQLILDEKLVTFIDWIANYNLAKKGLVLKSFIGVINANKNKKPNYQAKEQMIDCAKFVLKDLSPKQQKVTQDILAQIDEKVTAINLLDGVTGSGKTEIYFAAIAKILREDKGQILILLPEIALTSQLLSRFEQAFGFKAALWHSKITPKEKREIFYGLISGKTKVLIGARSALLLPFKALKLIVVDEEHDASFKQEDIFNFNARDMAVLKAKLENFVVILSSATPSLETYINAQNGKYHNFVLDEQFNQKTNKIDLIDLRKSKLPAQEFISLELREEIAKNLANKQQSLLFLNRRGYAPVTLCKSCGQKVDCPNCSSHLVAHKNKKGVAKLMCHYCGFDDDFSSKCRLCGSDDGLINIGVGAQRVKEEVERLFPSAKLALVTSDTVTNFKEVDSLVRDIADGKIDIIIGTQLIAKGYDFPNLTLVGIVDADSGFYSSELKSMERSFQLLKQVIGRAGRSEKRGRIFIQTYNPQNLIFEQIAKQDKQSFYDFEIQSRELLNMAPFTKMASFVISSFNENNALAFARKMVSIFPFNEQVEVFGPAAMPLLKFRNRYHYRIFLKVEKKVNLQKLINSVLNSLEIPNNIRIKVDIDP